MCERVELRNTRAYKRMGREGRIMMIITVITIIMKIP